MFNKTPRTHPGRYSDFPVLRKDFYWWGFYKFIELSAKEGRLARIGVKLINLHNMLMYRFWLA